MAFSGGTLGFVNIDRERVYTSPVAVVPIRKFGVTKWSSGIYKKKKGVRMVYVVFLLCEAVVAPVADVSHFEMRGAS
jgi:hypothetical protein